MHLFPLTRALIDIDSTTGRERQVGELLFKYFEDLVGRFDGGAVERMPVEENRFNVFAAWGEPVVVLSTHMDTVPPFFPSSEDEEFIHGRGACDTKGGIAAMLQAARELLDEGVRGFGLLFVVGEETDSLGAQVANRHPRGSRFLINGEPTENRLSIGQKGTLRVDLHATGRAAHSAYPEEGHSAIASLLDTIERIREMPLATDPLLGPSTLNVGLIHGGVAPNVLAPEAGAQILIRTVGPTDGLKAGLRTLAAPGVAISFPVELPCHKGGRAPAGWDTTVVSYASDLPFLSGWGEGYQLGPGTIRVAHTAQEHIRKDDLHRGVELYARLAIDLLAREGS
jgi:acetylornithine deacetylase